MQSLDIQKTLILQSKRKNLMPLQELCFKSISNNFAFFIGSQNGYFIKKLEPRLKTCILQYLTRRLSRLSWHDQYRAPPEVSVYHIEMVKLLINPLMTSFDFVVCGAISPGKNVDVWRCLIASAPNLTSITDKRQNILAKHNNHKDWLISNIVDFVVQCEKLENLTITPYHCREDDLQKISEQLPLLKSLNVSLYDAGLPSVTSICKLEHLECFEFQFVMSGYFKMENEYSNEICRLMLPRLKVIGTKFDHQPPHDNYYVCHNIGKDVVQELKLEHYSFDDSSLQNMQVIEKFLPNVTHISVSARDARELPMGLLHKFPKLTAVTIQSGYNFPLHILLVVGAKLTNIILYKVNGLVDVAEIINFCPNLLYFFLHGTDFTEIETRARYKIKSENLKLKKLHFVVTRLPERLMPALLKAPQLEEIILDDLIHIPKQDCKNIGMYAKSGKYFQNLKFLHIWLDAEWMVETLCTFPEMNSYVMVVEDMMKKIIANSPCLEKVRFDLPWNFPNPKPKVPTPENSLTNSLGPLCSIVNND